VYFNGLLFRQKAYINFILAASHGYERFVRGVVSQSSPQLGFAGQADGRRRGSCWRVLISLDIVIRSDYSWHVTVSELKRWLKERGCTNAKGSKHTKVIFCGKVTRMPRHPSQELKTKTLRTILKDLGLKM